ncbi:hypothetical protein GSS87_02050 [Corynebacterium sp. 4HC-13]|nr:hypothetical protein [Corynebacterium anserum]
MPHHSGQTSSPASTQAGHHGCTANAGYIDLSWSLVVIGEAKFSRHGLAGAEMPGYFLISGFENFRFIRLDVREVCFDVLFLAI